MSTAPNYRELFNTYHNGFGGYPAWYEHHKTMHAKHPLGCAEFGAEWSRRWEAVGRLLDAPARIGVRQGSTDTFERYRLKTGHGTTVAHCVEHVVLRLQFDPRLYLRIELLDGTIVKEWGGT